MTEREWRGARVVVTGATSGIGEALATDLAARGASVIAVGRDAERGRAVVQRLREVGPSGAHRFERADLETIEGVRSLAARLEGAPIDVLVNNAGGTFSSRAETRDGIERTFALNVLAPWLLTEALAEALEGGAVVHLVTRVLPGEKLAVDDLMTARKYSGLRAYSRAKLALEMVTMEQSRRHPGIAISCAHPGVVLGTRFGGGQSGVSAVLASAVVTVLGWKRTPEQAIANLRAAASAPESGRFWVDARPAPYPPGASDEGARRALFAELERLAGAERTPLGEARSA